MSAPVTRLPAAAAPRGARRERLGAYARLAKLDVFDQYLGVLVAWSLVPSDAALRSDTLAILALVLLVEVAVVSAEGALDDVQGKRDGSDELNYAPGKTLRTRARKPLLDGRLSERAAVRFAGAAALLAGAALAGAYAVAGFDPPWLLAATVLVCLSVLGYSWGPKLSYIGAQEIVLTVGNAFAMLAPFVLVTGAATGAALLQAALLGVWMLQFTAFSNTHDADGDRQAGRRTVAVRATPRGNRRFILGVFVVGWALAGVGVAAGLLAPVLLPFLLPALLVQAIQLRAGAQGDPLRARGLGIHAYRMAVLALLATNLLGRA